MENLIDRTAVLLPFEQPLKWAMFHNNFGKMKALVLVAKLSYVGASSSLGVSREGSAAEGARSRS